MSTQSSRRDLYTGLVWILSSVSLVIYGSMTLARYHVPGVEELVAFLATVDATYIYAAAFVSILIEGLYFFGSFFPGSTLIVVLTILSQVGGITTFVTTIGMIFAGWCVAGAVNITFASLYKQHILKTSHDPEYEVRDHLWTTWFPAFRANDEVAQVASGGKPLSVFWSSVRVKFLVSLGMMAGMAIVPLFIDIHKTTNEEGALSVFAVAAVTLAVGVYNIRQYMRS